jgi:chromosome segregation protein
MYLKEIVISGFKSFADRTRLDLRRGVTAVVGPNGCGKSNIVDAIRWVLGEQSAKALRGASMQDVIFEGTDQRKPLPICEVSLTFAECEAELGTAFNEVEISRRVVRDGGSDYYINGKVSRLKDIQRLFANTGVGRVSYSFMLQGQIDQILSTNPAERRTIFEEAAGITLYKSQRKEALKKLSLVDTNLTRVTDVIEEVSRQIGSLKRQASKALRYQRIKHRLTHLDLAFNGYRYTNLKSSIDTQNARTGLLTTKLQSHTASLEADEHALAANKQMRSEIFESLQRYQLRVSNLRSEKEHAENQAEFSTIRRADLQGRIEACRKEIYGLEQQQSELSLCAEQAHESKQRQLELVDGAEPTLGVRNADLVGAEAVLAELEAQSLQRRQAVLQAENRINRAHARSSSLEVGLKTYQVKHAALTEAIYMRKEEVAVLAREESEVERLLAEQQQAQADSAAAVEQARLDSQQILLETRELEQQLQQQDRELARKTAQMHVLESLQAKFEGFGEGAKAILGEQLADIVTPGSVSIISKELTVAGNYTVALNALLGMAAEALYVGDAAQALSLVARLDQIQLGRACLQIEMAGKLHHNDLALPDGLLAANSVVAAADSALSGPVARLLSGCYFASSLSGFLDFWQAQPAFNFLLVATPEGEVIDCRGLIYGGRASGEKPASLLERETEIRRLNQEILLERAAHDALRQSSISLQQACSQADCLLEQQRQEQGELASELAGLVAEARNQRQKVERNLRACQQSEDDLANLDDQHEDAVQALDTAQADLCQSNEALEQARQSATDLEAAIIQAREVRDQQRESLSDFRLELAGQQQRLQSLDHELEEVQREITGLANRISSLNEQVDTLTQQIAALLQSGRIEREKSVELDQSLQVATEQLEQSHEQLQAVDGAISASDDGLSGRRHQVRGIEQELSKLGIALAQDRTQLAFIQNHVQEGYQIELIQIDWQAELWASQLEFEQQVQLDQIEDSALDQIRPQSDPAQPTEAELAEMEQTDWEPIESELADLKVRIANMGPVNVDAISDYNELKERHDFLQSQSQDLWRSKNTLVDAIDEINQTSQRLFQETFDQVRQNFAFTYEKISGGGSSDLILVDSADPMESGIDIIARPPGTRLKSVTLLSGGQRTMAAVALLFAIYMVKPSPFCVLDEIDAALDDANIGRFCDILHGFTDKSQFLIVTHNKRTISNADTVYGVTMPEKGVSRMLSMRFNQETALPDLAAAKNSKPF